MKYQIPLELVLLTGNILAPNHFFFLQRTLLFIWYYWMHLPWYCPFNQLAQALLTFHSASNCSPNNCVHLKQNKTKQTSTATTTKTTVTYWCFKNSAECVIFFFSFRYFRCHSSSSSGLCLELVSPGWGFFFFLFCDFFYYEQETWLGYPGGRTVFDQILFPLVL